MKRTSAKVLISLAIILTMIPFYFEKPEASTTHENDFRVLFSFDNAKGITYVYADFIFTCTGLTSGIAEVTFKYGNMYVSYGMNDGEGIIGTDFYVPQAGYRTYQIEFENTSYFVFRFIFRDRASDNIFWDSTRLANPAGSGALDLSFSIYSIYDSTISANTSNAYPGLQQYTQAKIAAYLYKLTSQGLNIDTSTIEDLLEQIIANQQGNQSTTDASENLDDEVENTSSNVDDLHDLESTFTSDFSDSQEGMEEILQNTSLTAFSNAMNWYIQQLNNLYIAMGDMRILVVLPLILGIALFMIGRGAVIFREPRNKGK